MENQNVMLDRLVLNDDRLSFKAKGLYAYLLSKPEMNISEIVSQSNENEISILLALKELTDLGYITNNGGNTR